MTLTNLVVMMIIGLMVVVGFAALIIGTCKALDKKAARKNRNSFINNLENGVINESDIIRRGLQLGFDKYDLKDIVTLYSYRNCNQYDFNEIRTVVVVSL
ncbi:MAG: hypothetical protein ACRC0G_01630 [Fusobacteriaceae bacterium]